MFRRLLWVGTTLFLLGASGDAMGQSAATGVSGSETAKAGLDSDAHLVGWWKFDAASGTTAKDSSKNGHDGVLKGGLTFDKDSVSGRAGKALKLDGEEGFVETTGFKGVSGTQPRTVAVWIKTDKTRGEIIAWGEDDFGKMWVLCFVRGHVGVRPNGGYLYINDRISDGQWHHFVAVVEEGDPPNLHDSVKLFVDGAPAAIHDIGLLDLWPIDTGAEIDLRIGKGFNGLIDDVRIYDRALSGEEVKALWGQE